jgi:lipopolysaccharide transport system permease protein
MKVVQKTIITPKNYNLNLVEIIKYRELIMAFFFRDFKVRYAQSILGVLWAIINPLVSILILSFVFGTILNTETNGVDHLLFTAVGMSAWSFFSFVISESTSVIVNHQFLVTKIYFPKIILPISKIILGLFDIVMTLIIITILMFIKDYAFSISILYLPLVLFYSIFVGFSFSIWASALSVRFRDFIHIVPLGLRIGIYLAPIAYSSDLVPEKYLALYCLNPIVGLVDLYRWSFLNFPFNYQSFYFSFAITSLILISGLLYFKKVEAEISDII